MVSRRAFVGQKAGESVVVYSGCRLLLRSDKWLPFDTALNGVVDYWDPKSTYPGLKSENYLTGSLSLAPSYGTPSFCSWTELLVFRQSSIFSKEPYLLHLWITSHTLFGHHVLSQIKLMSIRVMSASKRLGMLLLDPQGPHRRIARKRCSTSPTSPDPGPDRQLKIIWKTISIITLFNSKTTLAEGHFKSWHIVNRVWRYYPQGTRSYNRHSKVDWGSSNQICNVGFQLTRKLNSSWSLRLLIAYLLLLDKISVWLNLSETLWV